MNAGCIDIYSRFQKILFSLPANKWMSCEWSYDNIDYEFFNRARDFEQYLDDSFRKLKTRRLTRSEWCRIRKHVNPRHKRLFSRKYLHEKRNELNRFRNGKIAMQQSSSFVELNVSKPTTNDSFSTSSMYGDMQLTAQTSQESGCALRSVQSNFFDKSENHLYRLLVETSNYLTRKTVILNKIKQLMESVQGDHIAPLSDTNEIGGKLILELYSFNTIILANFEKLWNFHLVKATLLFTSTTRIKADYFHRKCELAIFQKQLQGDSIQEYQVLAAVIESLLTLAYMLTDCGSHTKESFTEILTKEIKKLKLLCRDESTIFEQEFFPQLLLLFIKSTGNRQDIRMKKI